MPEKSGSSESSARWFPFHREVTGVRLRLFCFSHAGGSALPFKPWIHMLLPAVEACPVELPGRGARFGEGLLRAMPEAVAALSAAIEPLLDLPFAFFGHSLGAALAFELSRRLTQHGVAPEHLFVAACAPPHISRRQRHDLPEPQLVDELIRMNGTPKVLMEDASLRRILLPMVRADLSIFETYTPASLDPLPCPITAFSGSRDPEAPADEMEHWSRYTTGRFQHHLLEGDHFFPNSAVARIVEVIRATLP